MVSPFKFLDPYTAADQNIFFGRQREIAALYQLVSRAPIAVVYGPSGVGKTSLIQCGLASRMDTADWIPVFIRRNENINHSFQREVSRAFQAEAGTANQELPAILEVFFKYTLRPPYLIFDQLEELFILGNQEEIHYFIDTISRIVASNAYCKIILVIREDYLGYLYPFEQAVTAISESRFRVEPMSVSQVSNMLQNLFKAYNINLEEPEDIVLNTLIDNVRIGRAGIDLSYLQVYLDLLYRKDYQLTYPDNPFRGGHSWPPLTLTLREIEEFGQIGDVLGSFLEEEQWAIQQKLNESFPETPDRTVTWVLDALVTEEGTKKIIAVTWAPDGRS